MSIVVPNVGEAKNLELYLNGQNLLLRLFSNNVTPGETDTAATFTEVAGGGYGQKTLLAGSWVVTSGNPSIGTYAQQVFTFTGPTNAPGTIYGYYVVDGTGILRWAERFPSAVLPLTPIAGSTIRITPNFQCS